MGVLSSKLESSTTNLMKSMDIMNEAKSALQNENNSKKLNEKLKNDADKIIKTLDNAKEKEHQTIIAVKNEEATIKLAETLKEEAEKAHYIASQVINLPTVTEEVKNNLIDNALNLNEKAQNAQSDANIAIGERINAQQAADIANQQAKLATELLYLNKSLEMGSMNKTIEMGSLNKSLETASINQSIEASIINKSLDMASLNKSIETSIINKSLDMASMNKTLAMASGSKMNDNKFKFVNVFELKCPDKFVQNGTICGHLIDISKPEKKKPQQSNTLILLIILALIAILAYRNKNFVKKNFNITL